MPTLRWRLPEALVSAPEVAYRNGFATALAEKSPAEIVTSYVYLTREEMERVVSLAERHVLDRPLAGDGIELGAGCGVLSAIVARKPDVKSVLALEACEVMASRVMPKVASWILGEEARKVIPVVGSFDDMELPDASLDFVMEIDSLHHSHGLARTLRECARVLKPGGRLLCFDRCHPNTLTDQQVEDMLSQVYSRDFLTANHYPVHITLTRRENGEHEYRLFEWEAAFQAAGLRIVNRVEFGRVISAKAAVKGILSILPKALRRRLWKSDGPTCKTTLCWIWQLTKDLASLAGLSTPITAPKRTTVFLADRGKIPR